MSVFGHHQSRHELIFLEFLDWPVQMLILALLIHPCPWWHTWQFTLPWRKYNHIPFICDPDLSASEENNRKYNNIPFICDPDISTSEENNRKYNNIPFFAIQISRHQRKITENTTTYRLFVIQISRHQRIITENTTTCPFLVIQISHHQRKGTQLRQSRIIAWPKWLGCESQMWNSSLKYLRLALFKFQNFLTSKSKPQYLFIKIKYVKQFSSLCHAGNMLSPIWTILNIQYGTPISVALGMKTKLLWFDLGTVPSASINLKSTHWVCLCAPRFE